MPCHRVHQPPDRATWETEPTKTPLTPALVVIYMSEITPHVMIDIETVGTEPGDAILSIAAVRFNRDEGFENSEFTQEISLESCVLDYDMDIDGDTVEWLDDQEAEFTVDGKELHTALKRFNQWFPDDYHTKVWAKSPSFDCQLLKNAYGRCDINPGWNWWNERDVRTANQFYEYMAEEEMPDTSVEGTAHEPLYDAKKQAVNTMRSLDMAARAKRALNEYESIKNQA